MKNNKDQHTEHNFKDEIVNLHEIVVNAEDCISLLQNAFIYHNSQILNECEVKIDAIKKDVGQVTERATEILGDNPDRNPYVSIPAHTLKIVENIEKLSEHINKKNNEHILFSDKAVSETIWLLQRITEILMPTSDIILARNTFLTMYIQESQEVVGKMALEYATLHEDRLIKGVCNNASSLLFLGMLDSIKGIAWHAKEVAVKLTGK
jgi:Na+/phosphate symporter